MAENGNGKKIKQEWVSGDFSDYLSGIQRQVEGQTGKSISKAEITSVLAAFKPQINIPERAMKKEKDKGIFDF